MRSRPRSTTSTSTASSRSCAATRSARSSSSSPIRSARWTPPTRSTACRWATTACRRSSRADCRANAKPPRVRSLMGKRSRRRGEVDEATAAPPGDGAVQTGSARVDGKAEAPEAPARGGAPQGDLRLRQAMDYVEEADMLLALFRWTVLTGDLPRPEDWMPRDEWPHPDAVGNVFGNWNKFLEYAGVKDAPPVLRKRSLDERETRLAGQARQLEREEKRMADMRRQLDVARRKRDEAEALRDEQARRVGELERRLAAAERLGEEAQERLVERREAAERAATETT